MIKILKLFLRYLTIYLFAQNLLSYEIEWNYNNNGKGAGSGCPNGIEIAHNGRNLKILVPSLKANLTSSSKLLARKFCRIVIPTRLSGQRYISEITQSINYGYKRTRNTRGEIFSSISTPLLNRSLLLKGAVPNPNHDQLFIKKITLIKKTQFSPSESLCDNNDKSSNFIFEVGLSARRPYLDEEIIVNIGESSYFTINLSPKINRCL